MSKYRVFSGPYFPSFELNTERYEAVSNKHNAEINLGKVGFLLMLSTDNRIVKTEAKNRKKGNRSELCRFFIAKHTHLRR